MRKLYLIALSTVLFSCDSNQENEIKTTSKPALATWRAELTTNNTTIPFNFELFEKDGKIMAQFINDTERLVVENVRLTDDSIFIPGYIFESELQAKILDSNHIKGIFKKFDTKDVYEIPFEAFGNQAYRIKKNVKKASYDFSGKWEVTFIHETDTSKAIGQFNQNENNIKGTFLTPTGDYRFLKGEVDDNTFTLSTFDGTHAFVFNGISDGNDNISGKFFSGMHWEEDWFAVRNDSFELPNPQKLTYLNEGYETFDFSFTNAENGELISSTDEKFKNKVIIVQIMGSWCPNCMDETIFLKDLKKSFPEIEIVAVCFEKDSNFEVSSKRVLRVKSKLEANYPFLIAGVHSKESTQKALPMLNKISSYPTAILIDKNGKVVDIHTGFSGPGTGNVYQKFKDDYTLKVKNLLSE